MGFCFYTFFPPPPPPPKPTNRPERKIYISMSVLSLTHFPPLPALAADNDNGQKASEEGRLYVPPHFFFFLVATSLSLSPLCVCVLCFAFFFVSSFGAVLSRVFFLLLKGELPYPRRGCLTACLPAATDPTPPDSSSYKFILQILC